jgi:hypothetical protein
MSSKTSSWVILLSVLFAVLSVHQSVAFPLGYVFESSQPRGFVLSHQTNR